MNSVKALITRFQARIILAPVVLATVITMTAAADAQERAAANSPGEEITVTEKKPIRQLRREMDIAEKSFFSMFNKLNSDDDFDTKCRKQATLGSRKKVQVCMPKYLRVYEASLTSGASGSMRWDTPFPTGSRMAAKRELMRKEIDRLLADNENFRKVFQDFAASKRAYEIGLQN